MNEQTVGSIRALYRYPVKSMLGESHSRLAVDTSGVVGDRAIALIDKKTGKLVTAKQPALWKAMLKLQASLQEDGKTAVTLPSGEQFVMQDEHSAQTLSEYLGRSVEVSFARTQDIEMERADPNEVIANGADDLVPFETMLVGQGAPDGTFVDYGPIHLIATSSLNRVGDHSLAGVGEPARFRPNLIIDTAELGPYCENQWIGNTLNIGDHLVVKIILPTPRCAIPTLEHGNTNSDRTVLAPLIKENIQPFLEGKRLPSLGVYATVVSAGVVAIGDTCSIKALSN